MPHGFQCLIHSIKFLVFLQTCNFSKYMYKKAGMRNETKWSTSITFFLWMCMTSLGCCFVLFSLTPRVQRHQRHQVKDFLSLGILSKWRRLANFPLQKNKRTKNLQGHLLKRNYYQDGPKGAHGQTASATLTHQSCICIMLFQSNVLGHYQSILCM